jgi:hypothetical protein
MVFVWGIGVYIKRGPVLKKEVPVPLPRISIVFYFTEDLPLSWYR